MEKAVKNFHLKNIRALLTSGFDEDELREDLCFYEPGFKPLQDKLSDSASKAKIIDQIIKYANRELKLEDLLAWAKEHNPSQYEEHQPYYEIPAVQSTGYVDFKILLDTKQGVTHPVKVTITPSSEILTGSFIPPFDNAELLSYLTDLEIFSRGFSTLSIPDKNKRLIELGTRLFDAIFQGQIRQRYEEILHSGERLLIQISSKDPSLLALPWEFIYDPNYRSFLAQYDATSVVRLIELPSLTVPVPGDKLRVLTLISSPENLPRLNILQEKKNIETLFNESKGQVDVEFLEQARFNQLVEKLEYQNYHVLHFIGHGGVNAGTGNGFIYLDSEMGQAESVSGETLGILLRNMGTMWLVVLNSCESARSVWPDPFASVAEALIRSDIPAVVAMQFPISDQAALTFSKAFYTALIQGHSLIQAIARGRRQIQHILLVNESPLIYEWGTPVLYLGSNAAHLLAQVGELSVPAVSPLNEATRQEIAYVQALKNSRELQKIRQLYVSLQATADQRTWESELDGVSSITMRGGDEFEELNVFQRQMGVQLLDEISRYDQVVVLGKPGSGKTMTLKYMTHHFAELALQNNLSTKLPLLVNLSEYSAEQDVRDFLQEQLVNNVDLPQKVTQHLAKNLKEYLIEGRLILLLDGLNELRNYRQVINRLIRLMRQYPDNVFIFTSRDIDYRGELNIEHQLYIDQLDDQRIITFVDKRHIKGINGQKFLRFLKDSGLIELARSPYLLFLLLGRAERQSWEDISRSRAELFEWTAIELWTRERNRPGRDGVWIEEYIENEALIHLAWKMNGLHTTTLERIQVEKIFRDVFAEIKQSHIIPEEALKQAVGAGLLTLSSNQQIHFQHQLLQDYFAARQLKRQFEAGELFEPFITDLDWHEAVILLAGLLGENTRRLIETILTQPDDLFLNNLWLAARCLGEAQSALPHGGPRLIRTDLVNKLLEILARGLYLVLRRNAEVALVEIGDSRVISGLESFILNESFTGDLNPQIRVLWSTKDLKQTIDDAQADFYLPVRATRTLGKIGTPQARERIVNILENDTLPNRVRTRAIEALGQIGGPEVEETLIQVLNNSDQHRQLRLRTILALGKLGSDAARKQLMSAVNNVEEMSLLRERAVVALLNFSENSEVKDILFGLVNNPDEHRDVRSRACDILARLGGEDVREVFTRLLNDTDEPVQIRARAILSLGVLGNSKDISLLTAIFQDRTLVRRLRWSATYALGYILQRVRDENTVAMLGAILKDEQEDNYVRWTAAYALGFSKSTRGLRELLHFVSNPYKERDVERRAVEALGRYYDDEAVEALIKIVRNPEAYQPIKDSALHGLTQIGGERAISLFINLVKSKDNPPNLRRRALLGLGTWGSIDEVTLLQEIIDDSSESFEVRDQAFTALERISRSHRLRLYPKQTLLLQENTMLVETFAIPVLNKAVDFLFDQVKKILEERRAARQSGKTDVEPPNIPLLEQEKEVVLKHKVSEEAAKQKERRIQAILEEVAIREKNYQDEKINIARHGSIYDAPTIARHRFQEAEDALLETSQRLANEIESLTK